MMNRSTTATTAAANNRGHEPAAHSQTRRLITSAVVLAACVACAEGETLSAGQVLDSMLSAIGAERSRQHIQSLSTTADVSGPDGPFETTVTSIPPDTVYLRQASERGITEIWSTPERTWGGKAGEEYGSLGPQVRDFVRGQEFHLMLLDVKSRFADFALQDAAETVAGDECLRISMTDEAGKAASLCVRTDNWLPAELQLSPESTTGSVRILFGDWSTVDGLNVFHSVELTEAPERVFAYDYVDISLNTFAYEMRVPPPTPPRPGATDNR